ncbi:BnaA08g20550D [Brassica napus]|uniref:Uncharacterized protein n=2 Tax=Brassica TaxID=3705 RepID=A0A3P6C854_BRACM|nr:unnamed protein product [Brassica napus]CDY41453.1 BnaA08g20550D [Brassica napus]VDD06845.1 unnamed protein product [Brassica rapa]
MSLLIFRNYSMCEDFVLLQNSEPYIDGAGTEPDHVIRTTVRGWIIIENICKKYGISKKFTFMCSNLM